MTGLAFLDLVWAVLFGIMALAGLLLVLVAVQVVRQPDMVGGDRAIWVGVLMVALGMVLFGTIEGNVWFLAWAGAGHTA